jgi:CHRD domain-containing protein
MKRFSRAPLIWLALAAVVGAAPAAAAGFAGTADAALQAFEEVPAVFSFANGTLHLTINEAGTAVDYDLEYQNTVADVTQAHIHFAQKSVNGGIMVFFCSNLGNGPVGTPACGLRSGHLTGTFEASDLVTGAAAQGISTGQIKALVWAIVKGTAYANVHSVKYPGGEIRGQIVYHPE